MTFKPEPVVGDPGPLPSLVVCIVTMTPELCRMALQYAQDNADSVLNAYVFENGCTVGSTAVLGTTAVHSDENVGVVPGLHRLYEAAEEDILVFIHDDLEIYESDWDLRIRRRFAASPDCVLVGFGGAETLGRPDMYTCGSEWEPTRGSFGSNLTAPPNRKKEMTSAEAHGPRITQDCRAVIFDGFGFAVRRSWLKEIGGFSWWPMVNHGYDYALSCMARRYNKEVWLCPIKMGHPWIGSTSQTEAGLSAMAKHGGNYGVYIKSVATIREMFKDVLPFGLPGVVHTTMPPAQIQPIIDNYFGSIKETALPPNPTATFALDILKRALTGETYSDPNVLPGKPSGYSPELRANGKDWPATACTMVGRKRLDNFQDCIEKALGSDVPGDIVETGVWRGGASILARGVLKAHGIIGRQVFVCDSFEGLPKPDAVTYPADKDDLHYTNPFLAVSIEQVRENFARFGLLDEQVTFVKGWFKDTLHKMSVHRIAVLRLDGDMYESTMQALDALYPKISKGGYCIIDDYHDVPGCKKAVIDFRAAHGITDPIVEIDGSGVFWRREKTWFVPIVRPPVTLVIPTLTEAGAARTKNLIEAAFRGTQPPDNVFVIDNGGAFASQFVTGDTAAKWGEFLFHATVFTPGKNLGVAASWNEALKRYGDWCIFANDDAEIAPDTIERFTRAAETRDNVLITCDIKGGFPFFLLKQAAVRAVGLFDEQFYPAYYEDDDYVYRLKQVGLSPLRLSAGVVHGPGGTSSQEAGLDGAKANLERYIAKHGGPPGKERSAAKGKVTAAAGPSQWSWKRPGRR